MSKPARKWDEIAAQKREDLLASIPNEWIIPADLLPADSQDVVVDWPDKSGWFTAAELAITNCTAVELLPKLASGQLKSEDATRAFCKRAAAAHQLTNCLSETCFDRALEMARERDAHMTKTGQPLGPLHGLPVSLKDNFNLKGLDATVGFSTHVGDAAESDSALAQLLESAGAVFYVKTNVPTAMMIAETVNNVFGRTLNPLQRKTTPGGSSGGEAALITFKGSPLGVGTDIGGSLRIPAACTGLFTLRPSFGRFPVRNCRSGLRGQETVPSVNGPLARTLADIQLYSKVIVEKSPSLWDPKCLPIPWRTIDLPAKLKIAVMWNDGIVQPTPPVARALRETVRKLKDAGHEVIEWDPVDQREGVDLITRMFLADGGTAIRNQLQATGEPWREEMGDYERAQKISVFDMWQLQYERNEFSNRYLDRWNNAGIDAILCPTLPFNTITHNATRSISYTCVFNVLDYSCVSFPTGMTVDKAVDQVDPMYKPLGRDCEKIHQEYNPATTHGMPLSLQLVGRRLEEEKVLAMTERVVEALSTP